MASLHHPASPQIEEDQHVKPARLALICGRYEGVDERVRQHLVTDQISIGDFVITGGELPALILIDAVSRLIPGVLGDPDGAWDDSHASGLLEYPHYTRPAEYRGSARSGYPFIRRPRTNRPLAARAGFATHMAPTTRFA